MANNKHDLIILFSGGADSALMLEFAKMMGKNPYCILIDYEQLHKQELSKARGYLDLRNIQYQTVSIKNLNVNSGLTGNGKSSYDGVNEKHVPGRNTIFLSIALSIAESKQIEKIWIGADYSDREHLFPDCYQEYYIKINELFKITGSMPITIEAPLLGMTKETVISILKGNGINVETIYSGYGEFE